MDGRLKQGIGLFFPDPCKKGKPRNINSQKLHNSRCGEFLKSDREVFLDIII
jgi:hypothetical protein